MSFVSRDFKPRRLPPSTGPRKIPLLRIVLLVCAGYFAFVNRGQIRSSAQEFYPKVESWWLWITTKDSVETFPELGRKEQLAFAGGKTFKLHRGSIQESWRLSDTTSLTAVIGFYKDERIQTLVRTLSRSDRNPFLPGILDLVFRDTAAGQLPLFARYTDTLASHILLRVPIDPVGRAYRYIDLSNTCVWLEPCPTDPLAGGVVPIPLDFDFGGREHLLTHDLFRGIGETPVVAVLPGRIQRVLKDSTQGTTVEILHSNNQLTRSIGLAGVAENIREGLPVEQGQIIGRLSARDTVELLFQFVRNGQFVRWEKFIKESMPLDPSAIATFQRKLQL